MQQRAGLEAGWVTQALEYGRLGSWAHAGAVAQWKSAGLESEGPLVRASPASLRCVLEQEH